MGAHGGRSSGKARPLRWVALALASAAAALASVQHLIPHAGAFPSYDSTAYIFVADGILAGRVPFVQLWENKGLPIYAFDMLGRLLTPGSYLGIWVLEWLFVSLAFAGLIWTLRRISSPLMTVIACCLFGLGIVMTAVGGNTPEFWLMPMQASALVAAHLILTGEWKARRPLIALTGFAGGVAAVMKPNLSGAWIALLALVVALAVARRLKVSDTGGILRDLAAGTAVALVLSVGPLILWGATAAWWDATIRFGLAFTERGSLPTRLSAIGVHLDRIAFITAPLVAGLVAEAVAGPSRKRTRGHSERVWMLGFLAAWLAMEMATSSVNGRSYSHYSQSWLMPSVGLVALLWTSRTKRKLGLAALAAVLAASLWYALPKFDARLDVRPGIPCIAQHQDATRYETQARMVREVNERTGHSDTILVWGQEPIVFTETHRLSAGPYSHPVDILLAPGYQSKARFDAFVRQLEETPPTLIIDTTYPSIFDLRVGAPRDSHLGRVQPYMRTLPEFVEKRYRHVASSSPRVEYYELIVK